MENGIKFRENVAVAIDFYGELGSQTSDLRQLQLVSITLTHSHIRGYKNTKISALFSV